MSSCCEDARNDPAVGVIILTGAAQHFQAGCRVGVHWLSAARCAGKGTKAFCSGGDQGVRGHGGYVGADQLPRLNVLELQVRGAAAAAPVPARHCLSWCSEGCTCTCEPSPTITCRPRSGASPSR